LADPSFNTPGPIDILVGAGFSDFIMRGQKITGLFGTPSAYLVEFGYVIQGRVEMSAGFILAINAPTSSTYQKQPVASDFQMQKFWKSKISHRIQLRN